MDGSKKRPTVLVGGLLVCGLLIFIGVSAAVWGSGQVSLDNTGYTPRPDAPLSNRDEPPGLPATIAPPAPASTAPAPSALPPLAEGPLAGAVPSGPDAFQAIREAMAGFVTANASWRHPDALTVDKVERIGLAIGEPDPLTSKINELLPNTTQSPAGPVTVGPLVRARLDGNPEDVEVTPSESVDKSSAEVSMLWTWIVKPKRPMSALLLTAHVEVPLAGGTNGVLSTDIPLQIPVRRTVGYTMEKIFINWGTLSAIVVAVASGATWILKRVNRRTQTAAVEDSPSSTNTLGNTNSEKSSGTPDKEASSPLEAHQVGSAPSSVAAVAAEVGE